MTTWFSSDHHFGRRNIIEYCNRPYYNIQQMNADLVAKHNDVVADDDDFICVGDLSLSMEWARWASTVLKGNKILVPGNHDKCWPCHQSPKRVRGAEKAKKQYEELGWDVWPVQADIVAFDGTQFLISHLPYQKDERHGERYAEYRPIDKGLPLITGHVHDLWHTQDNQFNVGVDVNNYAPVNIDTIVSWAEGLRS